MAWMLLDVCSLVANQIHQIRLGRIYLDPPQVGLGSGLELELGLVVLDTLMCTVMQDVQDIQDIQECSR